VPDYYHLLGLNRDCDQPSVKRAYRSAARRLHPDLPANRGQRDAAREFRQVREAYEVLQDPERRRRYDLYGRAAGVFGASSGGGASTEPDFRLRTRTGEGVASIFEDLFAVDESIRQPASRRRRSPWNPSDLGDLEPGDLPDSPSWEANAGPGAGATGSSHRFGFDPEALAEAALAGDLDAANNSVRKTALPGNGASPAAARSATVEAPEPGLSAGSDAVAPLTGDELRVSVKVPFITAAVGGRYSVEYRVPDASGEWMLEKFDIAVPAGTHSGMESRCAGHGHFGVGGGGRGEAVLELLVGEHPWFRRVGADIYLDLPLSVGEAAAGCQLDVPTVHGTVRAKIPAGVRSGQQIRLRDQGLESGSSRGHQVLCVQVQVPRGLSDEHIEILQRIDQETGYDPRAGIWMDGDSEDP
jgi:molecular chaperone DnaJ